MEFIRKQDFWKNKNKAKYLLENIINSYMKARKKAYTNIYFFFITVELTLLGLVSRRVWVILPLGGSSVPDGVIICNCIVRGTAA